MRRWLRRQVFHLWALLLDRKPAGEYVPGDCEPCSGSGLIDCPACAATGWKDKLERF